MATVLMSGFNSVANAASVDAGQSASQNDPIIDHLSDYWPSSVVYVQNAPAQTLYATAKVLYPETSVPTTYQWYENTTETTKGAQAIEGATTESYYPSTTNLGTSYYFCQLYAPSTGTVYDFSYIACVTVVKDLNKQVVTLSTLIGPSEVVDVPGASVQAGTQVALWQANNEANQRFYMEKNADGSYLLKSVNSNLVLDASGAQDKAGTPIIQWPDNGGANQRWLVQIQSDGSYKLVSQMDSTLCIALKSDKATPGTVLMLAKVSNTDKSQDFNLTMIRDDLGVGSGKTYTLRNLETNLYLDISGASLAGGAPAITWKLNGGLNQEFTIKYVPSTGYYTITAKHSGLVLDVSGNQIHTPGTQVIQWPDKGGLNLNQQWYFSPIFDGRSQITQSVGEQALDVTGGLKKAGTPVIVWPTKPFTAMPFVSVENRNQVWTLTEVK